MVEVKALEAVKAVQIPARYQINELCDGLTVTRMLVPQTTERVQLEPFRHRGATCRRVRIRTDSGEQFIIEFGWFGDDYGKGIAGVIRSGKPFTRGDVLQLQNPRFRRLAIQPYDVAQIHHEVHTSWSAGIRYLKEHTGADGQVLQYGLREPQVGALHAIASHWTLSHDPAVVVMPTGTGKTEVMIASAVAFCSSRTLVIVPTDALRQQTADKFQSYGILESIGVIAPLPKPVVATLSSKPTRSHIPRLRACNVVVTTMSSIRLADQDVQREFASLFDYVVFDEAHHIPAATWRRFQEQCVKAKTLLLTATPFREDGKPVEGKIIYNYPLSSAQKRGYFKPIHFVEVFEPNENESHQAVARAAVQRLRQDIAAGHDHLMMARAETISAAEALFDTIYQPLYSDLNPILIHSRVGSKAKALRAIRSGEHSIIVCVDMFGEGFDLPNLKVAALHNVHKSLGVTLQFIGRFARTASNVGEATFVANTAEDGVPEALEALYLENADWNVLLADMSYDAIDPQARLSELVGNLVSVERSQNEEIEISTFALRPKMSAKVYQVSEFAPQNFQRAFHSSQRIIQPQISYSDNFLVFVVNQKDSIEWTDSRDIVIDNWDLYLAYFDPNRGLLYIHTSRKDSETQLAKSVSKDPVLIRNEATFKVFSGLRRLTLHSVGLASRSRNVRYQMYAGLDVRNAIDPVVQQSKIKSNIMGIGYEEGNRCSVGCSRKGKIWSMRSGSLAQWRSWCDSIGEKLVNPTNHPDDFLKYTLIPTSVSVLPRCQAIMADWPDQLFESSNFRFEVVASETSYGFDDCQIELSEWHPGADSFQFRLVAGEDVVVVLQLTLRTDANGDETYEVEPVSGPSLEINAVRCRSSAVEFFNENPPLVRLEDGSQLSGNILLKPREEMADSFDPERIQTLDWSEADLQKESRWKKGVVRQDSIQQQFINHLMDGPATFIVDDDDNGESADVVAIEETDDRIIVHLWHCKYSSGNEPGNRVSDLYEVCGQAQKCVKWSWDFKRLVRHLMNRETDYRRGRDTRFLRGSLPDLVTLRKTARRKFVDYRVGIVQPGLSKRDVPTEHLAILGATSAFVQCITDSPLAVMASE